MQSKNRIYLADIYRRTRKERYRDTTHIFNIQHYVFCHVIQFLIKGKSIFFFFNLNSSYIITRDLF